MKKSFLAIMLMTLPMSAWAYGGGNGGWSMGLALMYQSYKHDTAGTTTQDSAQTDYDLKIGYAMPSGLYLGAIYDSRTYGGSSTSSRTGYGAVVGYHSNGWIFDLDYYLSSTHNIDSTTNYNGGTNLQLDVGYDVMMGSSFSLGWQVAYKMLSYNQVTISSVSVAQENKYTEILPMIRLGFSF